MTDDKLREPEWLRRARRTAHGFSNERMRDALFDTLAALDRAREKWPHASHCKGGWCKYGHGPQWECHCSAQTKCTCDRDAEWHVILTGGNDDAPTA